MLSNYNAMRLEINQKRENMEAKQYVIKQKMGPWRGQRRIQKLPGDKQKQKHSKTKSIGHRESSSKRGL